MMKLSVFWFYLVAALIAFAGVRADVEETVVTATSTADSVAKYAPDSNCCCSEYFCRKDKKQEI